MENRLKFRLIQFFLAGFLLSNLNVYSQIDFTGADRIIKAIRQTEFPADTTQIVIYGAIGDGISDSRIAITTAIKVCAEKGGGVVLIPEGTFFCKGSISLMSNVNLHLSSGATLLFSPKLRNSIARA